MRRLLLGLMICFLSMGCNAQPTLNLFVFGSEIPMSLIQKFEKQTGIQVHYSTYDSNETMYAKLRANKTHVYDIIVPSGNYVERMYHQHLLEKLDQTQLSHLNNLDPMFVENGFDSGNHYAVPIAWGTIGFFYNNDWIKDPPTSVSMLWESRWKNQLLLLDDLRDVFSLVLINLGFNPNDRDPEHIAAAYQKLLALVPNIKLFSSDTVRSAMIDEDATLGISWNGDVYKAYPENHHLRYIYPKEGYAIWVDCLAIPKNAPHLKEAYQFINFMLEPQNAAEITLQMGYATTNRAAKERLPDTLKNNPILFPSAKTLKRGIFQRYVGEKTIELYSEYWEKFKLAF